MAGGGAVPPPPAHALYEGSGTARPVCFQSGESRTLCLQMSRAAGTLGGIERRRGGGYPTTRFRPSFFALYRFASATLMNCSGSVMSPVMSATPREMVTWISLPSNWKG